jgi:TolB-like protein
MRIDKIGFSQNIILYISKRKNTGVIRFSASFTLQNFIADKILAP